MAGSSGNFLNTAMATAKFTPDGIRIWSRLFAAANFDSETTPVLAFRCGWQRLRLGHYACTAIRCRNGSSTRRTGRSSVASTFPGFSGGADQARRSQGGCGRQCLRPRAGRNPGATGISLPDNTMRTATSFGQDRYDWALATAGKRGLRSCSTRAGQRAIFPERPTHGQTGTGITRYDAGGG
jgi:hypothetical protein